MRILVCGSRNWATKNGELDPTSKDFHMLTGILTGFSAEKMIGYGVATLDTITIIEGGAKGADACAAWWVKESPMAGYRNVNGEYCSYDHEQYPANWEKYKLAAGPIRNKQMLEEGKPDFVFAFTHNLKESKGTKHMVKIAKEAGIPVYVIGNHDDSQG